MPLIKSPRWLQKTSPLLVLQMVGGELRFVLRSGAQTNTGMVNLPATVQGRMFDVGAVRAELLPQLTQFKADVAVLLPANAVHIHHLKVPANLEHEELEYQVTRHITQELGLALVDVYYDWSILPESNTQGQMLLIVVARQTEVVQYAQLFADTDFKMRWVCAEPLIWARFLQQDAALSNDAVCQVEHNGLQFFWLDEQEHGRVLSKNFDRAQLGSIGFEYVSGMHATGVVQLPPRFVVDEIEHVLKQAHKTNTSTLHVLGAGVDWVGVVSATQSRMGLPVRVLCPPADVLDEQVVWGGLWQFSKQIFEERKAKLLNLWPHSQGLHNTQSPVARLVLEVVLASLLVLLFVGSAYAYFLRHVTDATAVNTELQSQVAQLQKTDDMADGRADIQAHQTMRAQNTGQLNWLADLPDLVNGEAQLTQVAQQGNVVFINGRAQTADAAQQLISRIGQMSAHAAPIVQSLESKTDGGVTTWHFMVQVGVQ